MLTEDGKPAFHNPGGSSRGAYPWLSSGLINHGNKGLYILDPDADIQIKGGGSSLDRGGPVAGFSLEGADEDGIGFSLPSAGRYRLTVPDAAGREIFRGR